MNRIFRNLTRNRLYTALNISGLTIGMAGAMLIALWVQNELRFDRYHRNAANLWRVKADIKINNNDTWHFGTTPRKTVELCEKIPGIVATQQFMQPYEQKANIQHGPEIFSEPQFAYFAPGWFDAFDYTFVAGSAAGFGDRPSDLILTEGLARKIFGNHHALGEVLRIDSVAFTVHAVLEDPRPESSFKHQLILPLSAYLNKPAHQRNEDGWDNFEYNTFVALRPDAQPESIQTQLTQAFQAAKQDSNTGLLLSPLTDLHFDQGVRDDVFEKGSMNSVWIFTLVGFLILGMAAINYVSLTTARAQTRAREVGIRKLVGAGKSNLFGQFMQESLVLATMAGLLAVGLVQMALPWFSNLADSPLQMDWTSPLPWILMGGTVAITVLLAGVYPALLLAGFQPLLALRGQNQGGSTRSIFRQSLVVFQFAVSVALLACTIVIGTQRSFIQNKEMGYDRAQIFSFKVHWQQYQALGTERGQSMMHALEQDLRRSSAVTEVSRASESPVNILGSHSGSVRFDGLQEGSRPTVSKISADENFAKLFNIQLSEGRWFEKGKTTDDDNVILNETAAKKLGLPQPWLGQRFGFHGREGQVIGLVRDFHFLPLHEAIPPLVIFNSQKWRGYYFVKTQPGQSTQALAAAETIWKQFFPERPFEYAFLDEDFDKMYRSEQRIGVLFNFFACMAIFISCLGLFGLATFIAAQRTKEIGIRKVLGASVAGITGLLAKDFLILVVIAIGIASPLAYYAMDHWLSDFAYRIDIQWWMFAAAGLAAVVIAVLTVGFQSIRAALVNPVRSLRSE